MKKLWEKVSRRISRIVHEIRRIREELSSAIPRYGKEFRKYLQTGMNNFLQFMKVPAPERWKRCKNAVQSFFRELVLSLKEELLPFSWKKGLRYYRGPIVLLLVFCVLWAAPVVAANMNKDSLYDWWPDYVTIPLAGYPHKTFYPIDTHEDIPILSACVGQINPNSISNRRWKFDTYSSVDEEKLEALFEGQDSIVGTMIVCKVEVLGRRNMKEWYVKKAYEYSTRDRDKLELHSFDFVEVRIEEVFFDPYDLYCKDDVIFIADSKAGDTLLVGNSAYLMMAYPQKRWNTQPDKVKNNYVPTTYNCHYEWGALDNTTLENVWCINDDGRILFRQGTFPIRSDHLYNDYGPYWRLEIVRELYSEEEFDKYAADSKIVYEMYTEEQIDQYLYDNLTVYEDLWRKYAKRSIES